MMGHDESEGIERGVELVELRRFDQDRYYRPSDPEMRMLGTVSTLAHWRHRGRGPRFLRLGNRVFYRGSDINEFLDAQVVSLPGEDPSPD